MIKLRQLDFGEPRPFERVHESPRDALIFLWRLFGSVSVVDVELDDPERGREVRKEVEVRPVKDEGFEVEGGEVGGPPAGFGVEARDVEAAQSPQAAQGADDALLEGYAIGGFGKGKGP